MTWVNSKSRHKLLGNDDNKFQNIEIIGRRKSISVAKIRSVVGWNLLYSVSGPDMPAHRTSHMVMVSRLAN